MKNKTDKFFKFDIKVTREQVGYIITVLELILVVELLSCNVEIACGAAHSKLEYYFIASPFPFQLYLQLQENGS